MSGMWRKTLVYLGLVEEPEDHDELGPAEELPIDVARPDPGARDVASARRSSRPEPARRPDPTNVRPIRAAEDHQTHVRPLEGGAARVGIVRAASFDDAAEQVGERYRSGQPVLLDVGEVDASTGRRLLDFVSGVIYALRGRIVPAGRRAFLLVPYGIDVPLDERRRLSDLGYPVQTAPTADV